MLSDQTITCGKCGKDFTFTVREQESPISQNLRLNFQAMGHGRPAVVDVQMGPSLRSIFEAIGHQ